MFDDDYYDWQNALTPQTLGGSIPAGDRVSGLVWMAINLLENDAGLSRVQARAVLLKTLEVHS